MIGFSRSSLAAAHICKRLLSSLTKELPSNTSFVMNIFRGKLLTSEVFPFPKVLDTNEIGHLMQFVHSTEKFMETEAQPAVWDEMEKLPETLYSSLRELGVYGLQAPHDYGGAHLNNTEYARIVEVVGVHDLALGVHMGAHQGIGYKGLLIYGTSEQKQKYLPKLVSGECIAAYCLTEPNSGSDSASIEATAELSPDGKYYILNGTKIWISNGGIADFFTVFARTAVVESANAKKVQLTAFLVERSFDGVTHSPPNKKMGIRASNTVSLYFDNCKVPVENVLGKVGEGFKIAVNVLNQGRFSMSAALSGTMRAIIKLSAEHANNRKQFGRTLISFQSIQEKLSEMALRQYITESMAFMLAGRMDLGIKEFQLEAAVSKIYSSESAWLCIDEAIQMFGGAGFMKDTGLERVMRDLRVFRIFEGANDVLRLFIALTGLNYAGKHLTAAIKTPKGSLEILTDDLRRSMGIGVGSRQLPQMVPLPLQASAKSLGIAIDAFGKAAQSLLKLYGKGVVEEQFRLIRMADAAINLYGMACVLSRTAQAIELNSPTMEHEIRMTKLACYQGCKTVHRLLSEIPNSEESQLFEHMRIISKDISVHGGVFAQHPIAA